jgi:hypothetical protein
MVIGLGLVPHQSLNWYGIFKMLDTDGHRVGVGMLDTDGHRVGVGMLDK